MAKIGTLKNQRVDEHVPEKEEFETLNKEDKAQMTLITEILRRIDLSTKVALSDMTF